MTKRAGVLLLSLVFLGLFAITPCSASIQSDTQPEPSFIPYSTWNGDKETLQSVPLNAGETIVFASNGANYYIDIPVRNLEGLGGAWIHFGNDSTYISQLEPLVIKGAPKRGDTEFILTPYDKEGNPAKIFGKGSIKLKLKHFAKPPLIQKDTIVLGILFIILAVVFYTSSSSAPFWKKFYTYIPAILLCYFIPGMLNSTNVINGDISKLYYVSTRYLLPASLVLFTISIDFKEIKRLGAKAIYMFLAGTLGIVIGGPIAILIVSLFAPDIVGGVGPDAVWRGLATIAGSWIGGGANQTAMKEVFEASGTLFSKTVAVDVIVANIWMGFLLYGAGRSAKIDKWLKADASAIDKVRENIENYQKTVTKTPKVTDTMIVFAVAFGFVALAHLLANFIGPWIASNFPFLQEKFSLGSTFFWLVVLSTTFGLLASINPKARALEGVGASRMASVLLYVLVASVGMHMNLLAIFENPGLFLVGIIWMIIHVLVLLIVAKIIKAPFFFVAVGSQANVGGAASAPVVAGAFHPSLAPVGVLLAVLGYALGTYGAQICGYLMQFASGG